MSYSTTELIDLTGYSPATVTSILTSHGFNPVDKGRNGLKYWEDRALDYLQERKAEADGRVRTICIGALAHQLHSSCAEVRLALSNLGIEPLYINPVKKQEVYSLAARDVLKEQMSVEHVDAEEAHPLVTDKRCLKLSWFPATTPRCFDDLDD